MMASVTASEAAKAQAWNPRPRGVVV